MKRKIFTLSIISSFTFIITSCGETDKISNTETTFFTENSSQEKRPHPKESFDFYLNSEKEEKQEINLEDLVDGHSYNFYDANLSTEEPICTISKNLNPEEEGFLIKTNQEILATNNIFLNVSGGGDIFHLPFLPSDGQYEVNIWPIVVIVAIVVVACCTKVTIKSGGEWEIRWDCNCSMVIKIG